MYIQLKKKIQQHIFLTGFTPYKAIQFLIYMRLQKKTKDRKSIYPEGKFKKREIETATI